MKTRNLVLHLLFVVISAIQLYSSWTGNRTFEYIAKPLILLWIGVYFLLNTRHEAFRWLVVLAFFFSWIGDLILMFAWKNDLFFFSGIGGFFLSQVTYILAFRKYKLAPGRSLLSRKPVWLILFVLILGSIYWLIWPGLEGIMKPVVFVYAVSLVGMSIAAFNRYGRTNMKGFLLAFSGSLLFMASDSLLAVFKFLNDIPHGGFLVMVAYIAAQYLIMTGLAREGKEN
jgi:uncharacterized membrane protein YhhN